MPTNNDQRNPYTVPDSDLTDRAGAFVEWDDTTIRHAIAIVSRILMCAWATCLAFTTAHMVIYWFMRERIDLVLVDLPYLILFGALLIPVAILLPSRILVRICSRKIGVSGFLNEWDKNFKDTLGRPFTAALTWVGVVAVLTMAWQGVKVFGLGLGPSNVTWFLAMVIALSLAFVISLPICRIACLGIEKRLDKMEEATQLHSEL